MLLKQTIHLFLDSVGRSEEYEYYLSKFRSESHPAFAVLCPDLDSFRRVHSGILFDIQFLQKLDLFPAILLAGPFAFEMAEFFRSAEGMEVFDIKKDHPVSEITGNVIAAKERRRSAVLCAGDMLLPDALKMLIPSVSGRIHIIRMSGAIRDSGGKSVYFYNLKKENPEIEKQDIPVLNLARNILMCDGDIHISITSPVNLLREIFTVKGAGTIVREGRRVLYKTSLSESEQRRMSILLENSFQRKLVNYDLLESKNHFFIEEDFSAAAILVESPYGMYLTKFAVDTNARGSGIAQELWDAVMLREKKVFLRARKNNTINRWYASLSDGMHKSEKWMIFWLGADITDIPKIISYCLEKPEDFQQDI